VEKGSVLVVTPCIENLLVPNNPSVGRRDVNHLYPVSVSNQIIDERNSSLKPGICPFRATGIGNVESSNGDGLDLVGLFRNKPLDGVLIVVA
jgi:hypothetical protein